MSLMDVEAVAVAEVKRRLGLCPHLSALVTDKDKVPFTDGHVDIYSAPKKLKQHFEGRVPVQVKGRSTPIRGKMPASFRISATDLRGFRLQGGVVFFAVLVHATTGDSTVAYRALTPFGIEALLDTLSGGQDHVTVPLQPFPADTTEVESIFWVALQAQDQRADMGFDAMLIEDSDSMTVQFVRAPDFAAPVVLSAASGDATLTLHLRSGVSIPMPGEVTIFPPTYLQQEADVVIAAGGICYERPLVRTLRPGVTEVALSDGLCLTTNGNPGERGTSVTLQPSNNLAQRMKDISFYLALSRERSFTIDGNVTPFAFDESPEDPQLREHLEILRKLDELCRVLGIDSDLISLTDVTDTQLRSLQYMHMSLIEGIELDAANASPGLMLESIGPWVIALLVLPGSDAAKWRYADPFQLENLPLFSVYKRDASGVRTKRCATAFDSVGENLHSVLNLNPGDAVRAYQLIEDLPDTTTLANLRVLDFIRAADHCEDRCEEFLDGAFALNSWLMNAEGDSPVHLINRWQILHRWGRVDAQERSAIRRLRRSANQDRAHRSEQLDALCAILLGDEEDIVDSLDQLSTTELREMQEWPIWALR